MSPHLHSFMAWGHHSCTRCEAVKDLNSGQVLEAGLSPLNIGRRGKEIVNNDDIWAPSLPKGCWELDNGTEKPFQKILISLLTVLLHNLDQTASGCVSTDKNKRVSFL